MFLLHGLRSPPFDSSDLSPTGGCARDPASGHVFGRFSRHPFRCRDAFHQAGKLPTPGGNPPTNAPHAIETCRRRLATRRASQKIAYDEPPAAHFTSSSIPIGPWSARQHSSWPPPAAAICAARNSPAPSSCPPCKTSKSCCRTYRSSRPAVVAFGNFRLRMESQRGPTPARTRPNTVRTASNDRGCFPATSLSIPSRPRPPSAVAPPRTSPDSARPTRASPDKPVRMPSDPSPDAHALAPRLRSHRLRRSPM